MLPEKIISTIVEQPATNSSFFNFIFDCAENGCRVWVISPEKFEQLPKEISPPEKEVLELITFMYLAEPKDIMQCFNEIHLWQNLPNVIIITNYDIYCGFKDSNYNPSKSALLTTLILNGASFCATKYNNVFLLFIVDSFKEIQQKLSILIDLYIPNVVNSFDELNKLVSACYEKNT